MRTVTGNSAITASLADIKRALKVGQAKDRPQRIWVGERRGILYATDAFWVVPASRLALLFGASNLTAEPGGSYDLVRGKLVDAEVPGPAFESLWPVSTLPVTPTTMHGYRCYLSAEQPPAGMLVLFDLSGGSRVAVRAEYLTLIGAGWDDNQYVKFAVGGSSKNHALLVVSRPDQPESLVTTIPIGHTSIRF